MAQIPKLLERIEKLQNTSKNLGWGHCVLDPIVSTTVSDEVLKVKEQYVVVCGHSYYKAVKTLVLEVYADADNVYGIFTDSETKDKFDVILCFGDEDFCIQKMIETLKTWFPPVYKRGE